MLFRDILFTFQNIQFRNIVDILLVAVFIYFLILLLVRTQALPVLQGFFIVIALTFITGSLGLVTINSILRQIVSLGLIAMIILFPSEIRKTFYTIGHATFWGHILRIEKNLIDSVSSSVEEMSSKKTGALIVFERNDRLQVLVQSGIIIDANVDKSLITAIFQKNSPMHDGAILIRRNRILAAGCFIPNLSSSESISEKFGTRHRAALGLSEQTDAVIIVVSEERGEITMVSEGKLVTELTPKKLSNRLTEIFQSNKPELVKKTSKA